MMEKWTIRVNNDYVFKKKVPGTELLCAYTIKAQFIA